MSDDDKRIQWCRDNIDGFAEMQDKALKARAETEASRRKLAPKEPERVAC